LEAGLIIQRNSERKDAVLWLGEILLDENRVTLAALQDALHALGTLRTSVACRVCKAAFTVVGYDPGRVYLCKSCTGELVPVTELDAESSASDVDQAIRSPWNEFGKYRSPTEIGRGAMGVVYKAWDDAFKRWVALKVIPDTGRLEDRARFRREVEIARSFHHPNIVALYEVTYLGSKHVIVMEYIEGKTLSGASVSPKRAAELVAFVARAVQYAHSRGVVHRDIKPQNILVDESGRPYLMDFGLAKWLETPSSVTSVGTAMGTPGYMAPEQAVGIMTRVDRRTDLYSLGAVLYELLTGQAPFRGANPLDTIKKVIYDDLAPPSRIAAGIPGVLEHIVLKCLEKDKNQRYQTARHLAQDLDREIPAVSLPGNAGSIRVIAGAFEGTKGPARTFTPVNLWDVRLNSGHTAEMAVPEGHTTLAMVLDGELEIGREGCVGESQLVRFDRRGSRLAVKARKDSTVLILSGEPIDEPIAGYGPFVMNTQEESASNHGLPGRPDGASIASHPGNAMIYSKLAEEAGARARPVPPCGARLAAPQRATKGTPPENPPDLLVLPSPTLAPMGEACVASPSRLAFALVEPLDHPLGGVGGLRFA